MKKNHFIFLLLLFACILSACVKQNATQKSTHMGEHSSDDAPMPKFSTPVTIEEVRSAFYRYSVVAIVKALHENNEANWNFIFEKVASGDKEWIYAFTCFIAPGTDTSSSIGVTVALAHALPNNPRVVLGLERYPVSPPLYTICTLPFIEPDYEFIKDYSTRTLAALRQVDDPYLLEPRDVCIRRLQEVLERYEALYKEGKFDYY